MSKSRLNTASIGWITTRVARVLADGPLPCEMLGDGERAVYWDMPSYVALALACGENFFFSSTVRYLNVPSPQREGETALDVGCGTGHGSLVLKWKGYQVSAIDKSPVATPHLEAEDIAFRQTAIEEFVPAAQYDLITCCDFLEHLAEPAVVLRSMSDWLAPGGRLYVTVPLGAVGSGSRWHIQWWQRESFRALLTECWTIQKEYLEAPQNMFWGLATPKATEWMRP